MDRGDSLGTRVGRTASLFTGDVGDVLIRVGAFRRLGVANLCRNAAYRIALKSGLTARRTPAGYIAQGPFFQWEPGLYPLLDAVDSPAYILRADDVLSGKRSPFGGQDQRVGSPPEWHRNVLSGATLRSNKHWSSINEFALDGDVKGWWDTARFDGLLSLTTAFLCSGDPRYAEGIEARVDSFVHENPHE